MLGNGEFLAGMLFKAGQDSSWSTGDSHVNINYVNINAVNTEK